jgi:hypothetical protein
MTTNIQSFAGDVQINNGNLSVKSLEVRDGITKLASNNTAYSNVGVMMTRKGGASNVALLFTEEGANVVLGYTNDEALDDDRIDILKNAKANLVVYGNVYVTGSVHGDGSTLTGLVTTLQSVTDFGQSTNKTILFTNGVTGINVSSNVLVSGNVTANVFFGDGGLLSNITQTLEGITAIGNTTTYTIEFNNTHTSFVTVSNVGIGNALPTADLCIGSNVVIDDERLNKIAVTGNIAAHQLNLGSIEILPAYSLENVTQMGNTTSNVVSFKNTTLAFDTDKMAGIGIIPSAADVGASGLHVDGHLRLGGAAGNTDEEQMYVKAAGALGVLANMSDTNNTNTALRLQTGDTNNSNIMMVGKSSAQYMTFGTNAAERMRITADGKVGVGTAAPSAKLHVVLNSETGSSNTVGLVIQNMSSDYTSVANGFGSRIQFKTNRGTDSTAILPSADIKGYIYTGAGGTTDYHALDLDVYGDNATLNRGISILSKSATGGPADTIVHGKLGIGTASPSSNLHVVGNVYATSNITTASNVLIQGTAAATSKTTGALQVAGGVGISGALYGDAATFSGALTGTSGTFTGDVRIPTLSTSVIGKITPVYVRGTGQNNNGNRLVKIGNTTHVNAVGRGLTLTIITASTHAHVSSTNYDTHGNTTDSNNLATALESMTDNQIGILTSYDAFEGAMTDNLVTACYKLGLTRLAKARNTTARHPYCAIFYGPGASSVAGNHAIEVLKSAEASGAYATISTFLVDDSFIGQTVTNALYSGNGNDTTPSLIVDKDTNVGIGTASPSSNLHVNGNVYVSSNITTASNVLIQGTAAATSKTTGALQVVGGVGISGALYGDAATFSGAVDTGALTATSVTTNDYLIHTGDTDTKVGFPANDTFTVTTANSERLRVNSSGNVGIGTTSPSTKLHIVDTNPEITLKNAGGSSGQTSGMRFYGTFANYPSDTNARRAADIQAGFRNGSSQGIWGYQFMSFHVGKGSTYNDDQSLNTERMCITGYGNVGIGTASPLSPLDVRAKKGIITAATTSDLFSNATIRISGYAENPDALCIGMLGTDNIGNNPYAYIQNIWDTPPTARPLLLNPAGGDVGIGTTSPSTTLHVNGTITCTSLSQTSDDRVKYNEQNVSNALTLISQLRPQKYEKIMNIPSSAEGTWIPTDAEWENVKENYDYGDELGFIAQDVRNIPELAFLVSGDETRTDTKTISVAKYSNLAIETQNTYTPTHTYVSTEEPISLEVYSNLLADEQAQYYELSDATYQKSNVNISVYSNLTTEAQQLYTPEINGYTKQIETQTPLSLDYSGLFVVAIGAMQELHGELQAEKAKVVTLETQLASVLARLDALEGV